MICSLLFAISLGNYGEPVFEFPSLCIDDTYHINRLRLFKTRYRNMDNMDETRINLDEFLKQGQEKNTGQQEAAQGPDINYSDVPHAHLRENFSFMIGAVIHAPQLYRNSEGVVRKASLRLTVTRGDRDIMKKSGMSRYDDPLLETEKAEIIDTISSLQKNDLVFAYGVLSTRPAVKRSYCSFCNTRQESQGHIAYIYLIDLIKLGHCESDEECFTYLEKHKDLSNVYHCVGTLLRDPRIKVPGKGIHLIQFPIGMNRKVFITSDPPDVKSDYPWVKMYNQMADYNVYKLKRDSVILIDGYIQTRNVTRHKECVACGKTYDWMERTLEIVPYAGGVEYESGVRTEEEVEALRQEKDEKLMEQAGVRWVTANAGNEPNEKDVTDGAEDDDNGIDNDMFN